MDHHWFPCGFYIVFLVLSIEKHSLYVTKGSYVHLVLYIFTQNNLETKQEIKFSAQIIIRAEYLGYGKKQLAVVPTLPHYK